MNKLISVVVPIYNSEKYLTRCIESIINQTYSNLEILLIDDGSDDNSKEICEMYCSVDKRIKVYSNSNLGVARTRKFGIDIATGEYISFVDSDDWLELNFFQYLIELINIEKGIDVACIQSFSNDEENVYKETFVLEGKEIFKDYFLNCNIRSCVWNKLYRKNIFSNINYNFEIIKNYAEDVWMICNVLGNSRKIVYSNISLYHYNIHNGSITKSDITSEKVLSCITAHELQIEYISSKFKNDNFLIGISKEKLYNAILDLYNKNKNYQVEEILKKCIRENMKKYGFNIYIKKSIILKILTIRYFPKFYMEVDKFVKKRKHRNNKI